MTNDVLKALAIGNVLVLTGTSAISLMDLTPLPLDCALGIVAASTFGVAGWLALFTISNIRTQNS
ncbi:hypothetical protein GR702_11690 [Novosphingobium sp. FGD1]|uniref:Uncharacterized protein n=1 Tax=Novosphingobium silvae TaxID=2692619 RepID=A0A7X4GGW2_9SPHN|nr:hypothetical protein [Novosphingobium silvae]MYL98426.1 hypothetical protein [Novosphingobium silvae]